MADQDKKDEAANALLDRIIEDAPDHSSAEHLRALAEAYAWVVSPRRYASS